METSAQRRVLFSLNQSPHKVFREQLSCLKLLLVNQTVSGNRGAEGDTALSLFDILTSAAKGRIAGGDADSVRTPVASRYSKSGRACAQIGELTWFGIYPGVPAT